MQHKTHPARLAAAEAGQKRWLGPECEHGHGRERNTASGTCVECNRIRSRDYSRRKNARPEVVSAREARLDERMSSVLAHPPKVVRVPAAKDPRRLAAEAAGERRWKGSRCSRCRTTKRYVEPPYSCVECRRVRQKRANAKLARKAKIERWKEGAAPEAVAARLIASAERKRRRKEKERRRRESREYQAQRAKFLETYVRPPMTPEQRERKRQRDAAYREANRERYRQHARNFKARKRAAQGPPNQP